MFRLTSKLALSNLYKNRNLYFPFTLAVILATSMLYIFTSLTQNPDLFSIRGGVSIQSTLTFGMIVIIIFSFMTIVYANSFVMKNRVKELGLYGILGLERRHLHSMVFFELVIFASISITIGIVIGMILDSLMYALLLKLIHYPIQLSFSIQIPVVQTVAIVTGGIFVIIFFMNAWRVQRINSLDLLREKRRGEKKSRFLIAKTVMGFLLLGTGYYIAQSVDSPVAAIGNFFWAVMAVIFATYLLFEAGSITFLEWLKKHKKYYYRPQNFISLSNLIFRMKRNAVGLATICIVSSMALVALVVGVTLYAGASDYIHTMYPQQYIFTIENPYKSGEFESFAESMQQVDQTYVTQQQIPVQEKVVYNYLQIGINKTAEGVEIPIVHRDELDGDFSMRNLPKTFAIVLDQATYQQITNETLLLDADEIAIYPGKSTADTFALNGHTFKVVKKFETNFLAGKIQGQLNESPIESSIYVVSDLEQFAQTLQVDSIYFVMKHYFAFNVLDSFDQLGTFDTLQDAAYQTIGELDPDVTGSISNKAVNELGYYTFIGSIFFIGVLLAILFASALVLIIYYKQVAEGMEDRERFVILEKVGLSKQAANQAIRRQIVTVFFLPVVTALIHCAFAFKMIQGILLLLGVINQTLILQVSIGTAIIFVLFYVVVFFITSHSYKKYIYIENA